MANNRSDAQRDKEINMVKGTQPAAPPATLYLLLWATNPTDNNGTSGVEISGSSYARQAITSATAWSAISTVGGLRQISNLNDILFPAVTTTGYTVVGCSIIDSSSGAGTYWYTGTLTSQAVAVGVQYKVSAGSIVITAG